MRVANDDFTTDGTAFVEKMTVSDVGLAIV